MSDSADLQIVNDDVTRFLHIAMNKLAIKPHHRKESSFVHRNYIMSYCFILVYQLFFCTLEQVLIKLNG